LRFRAYRAELRFRAYRAELRFRAYRAVLRLRPDRSPPASVSGEQRQQVGLGQPRRRGAVAEGGVHQRALAVLEREDPLLDGVGGDQAIDEDRPGLTDAMGPIGGLGFDGGVPPGVAEEDVVGGGQVEAAAAGLE